MIQLLYNVQVTKLLVHMKMRFRLLIAVSCLAGLRLSNAREDQTEETRDEWSLLVRRVNNLEVQTANKEEPWRIVRGTGWAPASCEALLIQNYCIYI